jgi:hypothetical protein
MAPILGENKMRGASTTPDGTSRLPAGSRVTATHRSPNVTTGERRQATTVKAANATTSTAGPMSEASAARWITMACGMYSTARWAGHRSSAATLGAAPSMV